MSDIRICTCKAHYHQKFEPKNGIDCLLLLSWCWRKKLYNGYKIIIWLVSKYVSMCRGRTFFTSTHCSKTIDYLYHWIFDRKRALERYHCENDDLNAECCPLSNKNLTRKFQKSFLPSNSFESTGIHSCSNKRIFIWNSWGKFGCSL